MKAAGCVKAVLVVMMLGILAGCDAKDKGATGAATPAAPATPASPASGAAAAPAVAPEKDKAEAKSEASRVLAQLKGGEFAAIYRQAAPAFRELGTEQQFVAMMQKTREKTGALQDVKETGVETGADNRQMVNYSVDYANVRSNLRLSFLRSSSGKLELVGLNQKDDVVKTQKKAAAKK
jgi:type IV pilus biogenesis protein CpaD/CtpE